MTKSEKRGKNVAKRAANGEIIISQSDKSMEITISSMESYIQQGEIHFSKETPSNWNEIQESIKGLLCHSRALTKVFNLWTDHPNRDRLPDTLHEKATIVPDVVIQ